MHQLIRRKSTGTGGSSAQAQTRAKSLSKVTSLDEDSMAFRHKQSQKSKTNSDRFVRTYLKEGKAQLSTVKKIQVHPYLTAEKFLRIALVEFQVDEDDSKVPHQLWVRAGKENTAYPLLGHENPFAIIMSHIRDSMPEGGSEIDLRQLSHDLTGDQEKVKCYFIVRPKDVTAVSTKKLKSKRPSAGQFMEKMKKRMMSRQENVDPESLPFPTGQLFGHDLASLVTKESPVPKPVMMLLEHIFCYGVFVDGIFRKSPKHSTVKALKEKLDRGEDVKLSGEYFPTVTASVLKEFLRNIPGKLLCSDMYNDWVAICDKRELPAKISHVKNLLCQLPCQNYDLLKHLMCVLHHVAAKACTNQMNSTSLAVCVGPSLLDRPNDHNVQESVRLLPYVTQFLIDNVVDLFGADTLDLFGKLPKQNMFGKNDSSEESDFAGQTRQETSSMDSFMASSAVSPGLSRPESSTLVRHPANVSRDSGLSDVHFTDEPSPPVQPLRSISMFQGEEKEEVTINTNTTKSVEDLSVKGKLLVDLDKERRRSATLDNRTREKVTESWDEDEHSDSVEYVENPSSLPHRTSKRIVVSGTLERSESGEHLLWESAGDRRSLPGGGTSTRKAGITLSLPVTGSFEATESTASSPDDGAEGIIISPQPQMIIRDSCHRKPSRFHRTVQPTSSFPSEEDNLEEKLEAVGKSESGKIVIRCNSKDFSLPEPVVSSYYGASFEQHSEASSSGASSLTSLSSTDSESSAEGTVSALNGDSTQLQGKIERSLMEAKEKLSSSKSWSRRSFLEATKPADSSTVTEASSDEEESTPVVSRESSRAQELKGKAKEMFSGYDLSSKAETNLEKHKLSPAKPSLPFAATVPFKNNRPPPSFSAWQVKYKPRHNVASQNSQSTSKVPNCDASVKALNLLASDGSSLSKVVKVPNRSTSKESPKLLPNYEEAVRRMESGESCKWKSEVKSAAPVTSWSYQKRSGPGGVTVTAVPYVPGQVRDRIHRYDRERLRRKTLGGEELLAICHQFNALNKTAGGARLCRAESVEKLNSPAPARNYKLSTATTETSEKQKLSEIPNNASATRGQINWSVSKLKTLFDDQQAIQPNLKEISTKPAVGGCKLETVRNLNNRKDGNTSESYETRVSHTPLEGSRKKKVEVSGVTVTISDSHANYPVVKPPPLAPAYSRIKEAPIPHNAAFNLSSTKSSGIVKNLISSFDSGKPPGNKPGEESYV